MAEPTPDARPGGQASLDPEITAALTELASRLEQRGLRAEVYVHDGMTVTMTHRDGDTTSTIDDALRDGPGIVGEIAADIAVERGLPADWLKQIGRLAAQPPQDTA